MEQSEKDLKPETASSEEPRQPETAATEEPKEETLEEIRERLRKVEEDRDKYKERVLGFAKKKEHTLSPATSSEEEPKAEKQDRWDDDSLRFQKQTLSEAEKIARETSKRYVEENNEKAAVSKFLSKYPDLSEDETWQEIVSNYHPKHGKGTVTSVMKDLERARVVMLHDRGELSKIAQEAEERGKRKGQAEAAHANAFVSSGSRSEPAGDKGSDTVSKGAKEIAKAFNIDPKKLASE